MKRFFLQIFAAIISLITTISCQESHYREIINIGDGQWRYALENREPIEAYDFKIQNDSKNSVATFSSHGGCVSVVKITLPTDVNELVYRVEVSSDNFKKDIEAIYKNGRKAKAAKEFVSEVSDANNSVGFVKRAKNSYVETLVNSSKPYWRVVVLEAYSVNKELLTPRIENVELFDIAKLNKSEVVAIDYDDSNWSITGIPHSYNDMDTFLNISNAEAHMWQGDVWYRHKFCVDSSHEDRRFILEFQGVSVGAAVYVNGEVFVGASAVKHSDDVTHVGCSLPFCIDISDAIKFGEQNILAVRVSNASNSFYTYPGFGVYSGFGMGWGGINAPVYLHIINSLHIAPNVYSIDAEGVCGVYVATTALGEDSATVRADINITNSSNCNARGELHTKIYDNESRFVCEKISEFNVEGDESQKVELEFDIESPALWFPNNSEYGIPALYSIENSVVVDGRVVDRQSTKFGIRTIEWDDNYCYVNGKRHFLRGFGYRNIYPALGSAVPDELQWRDVKYMSDCGANTLRVGHIPATATMLEACDVYGIMVIQCSGDNEWVLHSEPTSTFKAEYDRQMMLSQRNHPSIIVWESNNGLAKRGEIYGPERTLAIAREIDYLSPRLIHNRDGYPTRSDWNHSDRIMVGYTNKYKKVEGSPSLNTEVYGAVWNGSESHCIARFDFENEKQFSQWYIEDYLDDIDGRACGWIDWMLAETQGEGYTIYLNGERNHKSLGSSAMDGNRFAKLKYRIYQNALWIDYGVKPGVTLQTNWNLDGVVDIDAWSNCPNVELFVGEKSYGVVTPNSATKQATWQDVESSTAELRVVGYDQDMRVVCQDVRQRSGEPYAVELSIEPTITHPDGREYQVRANGSDAMLIVARIVDKSGNLCNTSECNINFDISGEGVYKGSYNFYVEDGKDVYYHAPGDRELQAEGGLMKIAVRSTHTAGIVRITATSAGLESGEIEYKTL